MLLEASCDKIEFITNLEKYPLSKAKFEALSNDWEKQSKITNNAQKVYKK